MAGTAEATGFDQFWVSNDLFLRSAPVILSAVAQATTRIQIGTGILNPYTIDPAEIAMMAATLDELSGNRFNLGMAAGAGDFLNWIGLEQRRPLAAMRESIIAIRALLSGEHAEIDGKVLHWNREAYLRFNAPRVTPIYVGAMGPKIESSWPANWPTASCPCSSRPSTTSASDRLWTKGWPYGMRACPSWTSPSVSGFLSQTMWRRPDACWPRRLPTTATH